MTPNLGFLASCAFTQRHYASVSDIPQASRVILQLTLCVCVCERERERGRMCVWSINVLRKLFKLYRIFFNITEGQGQNLCSGTKYLLNFIHFHLSQLLWVLFKITAASETQYYFPCFVFVHTYHTFYLFKFSLYDYDVTRNRLDIFFSLCLSLFPHFCVICIQEWREVGKWHGFYFLVNCEGNKSENDPYALDFFHSFVWQISWLQMSPPNSAKY